MSSTTPILVEFENIPLELREQPRWVVWKSVTKPDASKPAKVPFRAGKPMVQAKTDDATTWASFEMARAAYERDPEHIAGIGFVLGDGWAGADLDCCVNTDSGEIDAEARNIVEHLDSYAEVSPSGTGIKIFVRGNLPCGKQFRGAWAHRGGRVELYASKRYFTVTGAQWTGTPNVVEERGDKLIDLFNRLEARKHEAKAKARASSLREDCAIPMQQREERCWRYLQKCPDAISGQDGSGATFRAACECFKFALDDAAVWRAMQRFNDSKTGGEKWSDKELRHKIDDAKAAVNSDGEFGCRWKNFSAKNNGQHDPGESNGRPAGDETRKQPRADGPKVADFGPVISLKPPALPTLTAGYFPQVIDEMIVAQARSAECPLELPAALALASLAAACQGRFCVRPSPNYFEPLCIWATAVAEVGERKTASYLAMCSWAFKWQQDKAAQFEAIIRQAEILDALQRGQIKAKKDEAAKSKDENERAVLKGQIEKLESELEPLPVAPRLLVEDITSERMASLLKDHHERLTVLSDESGPLDVWAGRYSNGMANVDLALKAWSGSPATIDRHSKPPILLHHPLLSMGLLPQPAVVAGMLGNQTFRRRGLCDRFWYFRPEPKIGTRTLNTTPIPDDVAEQYAARLTELADLDCGPDGRPRVLNLSADAWKLWKNFARKVEAMMAEGGELEHHRGWGGKLPGQTARIAGLFHLAEHGAEAIQLDEIQAEPMQQAIVLARFAIPHARAVFETMSIEGDVAIARKMWRAALSSKAIENRRKRYGDPTVVSFRDLWHPLRGTLRTVAEGEPVLNVLLDRGFLQELPSAETGKPGRSSRRFRINPKVVGT
jgi:hypothetical protein